MDILIRVELLGHRVYMNVHMFNFRRCKIILQSDSTIKNFFYQKKSDHTYLPCYVPVAPHPKQYLLFSVCLDFHWDHIKSIN